MGTTKSGFVWINSHSNFTLPEEAIDECSGFLVPSQYGKNHDDRADPL